MNRRTSNNGFKCLHKTVTFMLIIAFSLSLSGCSKKQEADTSRADSSFADISSDVGIIDATEPVSLVDEEGRLIADGLAAKAKEGITYSTDAIYSFERHLAGLTNTGVKEYSLVISQSEGYSHIAGRYASGDFKSFSTKVENGRVNFSPEEAAHAGEGAMARDFSSLEKDKEVVILPTEMYVSQEEDETTVYTMLEGENGWYADVAKTDLKTAYFIASLFSETEGWKLEDTALSIHDIEVQLLSVSVTGDAALGLLEAYPVDKDVKELVAAIEDGKVELLEAHIDAYISKEKPDELVTLDISFADSASGEIKDVFAGTEFEGTWLSSLIVCDAFAYGEVDASVPEAVSRTAEDMEAIAPNLNSDPYALPGIDPAIQDPEFAGNDGMVDTDDYEKRAGEVQETGSFVLSSASCTAKAEVKNPVDLTCAFASDESVSFSNEGLKTSVNYGLYPEQYYDAGAITDMVVEWVDYLEENEISDNIEMSETFTVVSGGREYSCRTVSYKTSETSVSSLYAWTLAEPDALVVIQLQELGEDGAINVETALEKYGLA